MSESERRLWGIDLIACVYGLATILVVWLWFNGSSDKRTFAMVVAPLCAVVCIGLFLRINIVRVGFLCLLVVSLVTKGLLALFYLAAFLGILRSPPNKDPLAELMEMPIRVAIIVLMFTYLRRPDVRAAFGRQPSPENEAAMP
jgi:hypothetical protein